jgi:hypothetical protein
MTKIEKKQFANLVIELENVLMILNPEVRFEAPSLGVDNVDYSGITVESVHELAKALRVTARYNRFDLEACRREIASMIQIINEGDHEE